MDVLMREPLFADIDPLAAEQVLMADWSFLDEEGAENAVTPDSVDEDHQIEAAETMQCTYANNESKSQDTSTTTTTSSKKRAAPGTSEIAAATPTSASEHKKRKAHKKKPTYVLQKVQ